MDNLPPGTTQHDIDLHFDGVNCDECGKLFVPFKDYDDEEGWMCRRCLKNAWIDGDYREKD